MGDKLYSDIEEQLKKLESDTQYVKAFLKYLEPTIGDACSSQIEYDSQVS